MQDPKSITIAIPADAETLDPHEADDAVSFNLLNQMVEGLTRFADASIAVEPCLAERWTSSPDYRTWTFHLRPSTFFSDGSTMTTEDVVASFGSVKDFGGKVAAGPLPGQVVFSLAEPNSQFDEVLAQLYFAVTKPGPNGPIGTGPYRIESRRVGRETVLVRNERNTRIRARIERLRFRVIAYMTLLGKALAEGDVDMTDSVTPSMLSVLRTLPNLRLEYQMGLNTGFLCLNTQKPPLSDVRVRTAIAHAIDRAPMIQKLFPTGYGEPAKALLPPQLLKVSIPQFPAYDPEKARKLLADSQYRGETLRLLPSWAPRPYMPDPPAIAHDIARMLSAVGINVREEATPNAEGFFGRQQGGDYDLMLSGWIADDTLPYSFLADNLAAARIGRTNVPRYRNPAFDALLARMKRSSGAESTAAVGEALSMLAKDVPLVPLFHGPQIAAAGTRIVGKLLHPSSNLRAWMLTLAGMPRESGSFAIPARG